ncbi:MAG TPA: PAS domain S-box protein [Myxococcaceae bacterium]|nr:PAS domain S-box protein [Myxococcaceae bacterium]
MDRRSETPRSRKRAAPGPAVRLRLRNRGWSDAQRSALEASVALYRSVVASIAEGIVVQDARGTVQAFNDSALRILGMSAEQLLGREELPAGWCATEEDGTPLTPENHPTAVTLRTGHAQLNVLMGIKSDERGTSWILVSTQPLRERGESQPHGVVSSFLDVTERRARDARAHASEERFRAVSSQAPLGIFVTAADGRCLFVNETWCTLTGLRAEQARGDGWTAMLHPEEREATLGRWAEASAGGVPFACELRIRRPDGEERWVAATASTLRDDRGEVSGCIGSLSDVTARKLAEQERDHFFELSLDLLAVADLDGRFLRVSRSFEHTLGWSRRDLLARSFLELVHPEDLELAHEQLGLLARGEVAQKFELRFRCKDGQWRWLSWRTPPPTRGTRVLYVVARDVSAAKEEEQRLLRLAQQDPLTGLANRGRFDAELEARVGRSQAFAVLYLDLDGFKPINDEHGHAAGDRVLQQIGQRLARCVRRGDLVGRVGGDEFAVLLEGVSQRRNAEEVAGKLRRAVAEPLSVDGERRRLGVSIGVAMYPEDATGAEELLEVADQEMYREKRMVESRVRLAVVE